MPNRYFRLKERMHVGNWDLGDPLDESGQEVEAPWMFTAGRPVHVEGRLTIPVDEPGRRLDFCTAGIGVTPIVTAQVAALFAELAPDDVQLIPVNVQGHPGPHSILVATKLVRCIDDTASKEVGYWRPEDGRPEKVGHYRGVIDMRIDPTQVGDIQVFRTWGWTVALIVSEAVKTALERAKVTGAEFTEV